MDWLASRLVALGAALIITLILLVVADLASKYVGQRTHPPRSPHEYTVTLQPVSHPP